MKKIYKFNICIDVRETRRTLRKFFAEFNARIKATDPINYKAKRIKASQIHTLFSVVDFYAAQLYDAKKQNRQPGTFRTNNQKLARRTGCSDTTVWRHLCRFMREDMNIILCKTVHGPKADYELVFNPLFLIAQQDAYFNNFVKYHYGKAFKINTIPVDTLKQLASVRPSMTHAKNGIYLISLCNLIDTRTINFNMKQGIVDFAALLQKENDNAINREINNNLSFNLPEQPSKSTPVPQKPELFCAENSAINQRKDHINHTVDTHIFLAWNYAKKMLWPKIKFTDERTAVIMKLITQWFSIDDKWKNRPMIDLKSFCERITLAYRFIMKNELRYAPIPELYFNHMFKHGFSGTEKWLENINHKRKSNELFYYNHSLLISCYRNYAKHPGIQSYSKGRQLLSRKREKWLLEEYDKLILGISEATNNRNYYYENYNHASV